MESKSMTVRERKLKIARLRGLIKKDPIFTDWAISKLHKLEEKSEDERIRDALIEHFTGLHSSTYPYKGFTKEQILAWLEKQCK
jgi:hypothetical protein